MTHVAVCGAGAFGRNHMRVYRELADSGTPVHLAAVVEPAPGEPLKELETRLASPGQQPARFYPSTEAMLAAIRRGELRVDAASVCVPTSAHFAGSALLLAAGIHVLVEKPIAATLAEADELIALAARRGRILTVGHLERFNPAVQALAPLLRGPMFFEAHRLSVFSPRSLDTDVVLDLMIHDLDIVLSLTQSPVTAVHAVGLPILSGKTDIANVRVQFASGCVANFTASRVSTERVRKLRFFQPHQYLSVDYARQDLLVIEVSAANGKSSTPGDLDASHPASTPEPRADLAAGGSELTGEARRAALSPSQSAAAAAMPVLAATKPVIAAGEPLRLEIESFLHSIRTNTAPAVTGQEARDALALALQIQQAIAHHAQHAGLQGFTA